MAGNFSLRAGPVRGKIVALAVDVDAERELEPVDAAQFQRGIEIA